MPNGTEAVKFELCAQFNIQNTDITERAGIALESTDLWFSAEGKHFKVLITYEFHNDYSTVDVKTNLSQLGPLLRRSHSGRVTVTKKGIVSE